jgi:hypothetical protein
VGAQSLSFWLNAGGDEKGVDLVLRANYRGEDGTSREESFVVPVRLDSRSWRRVVIPLAEVKNANGPLLPRVSGVYLLQFVQRGTWDSRFFTIDDLVIEGTGTPLNQARDTQSLGGGTTGGNPTPTTNSTPNPSTPAGAPVQVNVDFLKKQGRIRSAANVSIGATLPGAVGAVNYPLGNSAGFRSALTILKPRFVRLDVAGLSNLTDSQKPAFDFARLVDAVKRVRALGSEPLLALTTESAWGLDARRYSAYVTAAVNAVNKGNARPVRWFEIVPGNVDAATALAFYNRAQTAIKALSPSNRVGGVSVSSGNTSLINSLMSSARGMDFLSVSFYGAMSGQPSDETLFASARSVQNLKSAAGLLDKSRFRNVPLFVTGANLNAARETGTNIPQDMRIVRGQNGVWWATFLGSGSRLADQVFHNDAVNPEWGLIDEKAQVYPAYYVMWMWNQYLPVGSERVLASALRDDKASNDVFVTAVNAPQIKGQPVAHNVLVANTRDQNVTVKIAIRGFPVLRAAQMHVMDDPRTVRQAVALPKSPFQTITLRPHSVAVVQFLEPPKK